MDVRASLRYTDLESFRYEVELTECSPGDTNATRLKNTSLDLLVLKHVIYMACFWIGYYILQPDGIWQLRGRQEIQERDRKKKGELEETPAAAKGPARCQQTGYFSSYHMGGPSPSVLWVVYIK
ncbi:hypothetical protein STEG23_006161, partial [Scotinomys teguina]